MSVYNVSILIWTFSGIDSDIKVLEDEFDELIVDVATKRRQYPRRILESVIKTLKAQHEILVRCLHLNPHTVFHHNKKLDYLSCRAGWP